MPVVENPPFNIQDISVENDSKGRWFDVERDIPKEALEGIDGLIKSYMDEPHEASFKTVSLLIIGSDLKILGIKTEHDILGSLNFDLLDQFDLNDFANLKILDKDFEMSDEHKKKIIEQIKQDEWEIVTGYTSSELVWCMILGLEYENFNKQLERVKKYVKDPKNKDLLYTDAESLRLLNIATDKTQIRKLAHTNLDFHLRNQLWEEYANAARRMRILSADKVEIIDGQIVLTDEIAFEEEESPLPERRRF